MTVGKPTSAERRRAAAEFEADASALAAEVRAGVASFSKSSKQENSEWTAKALVSFCSPATLGVCRARDVAAVRLDLVQVALALAAYHADHGTYPAKLVELAPRYIAEVPNDAFTGSDLHYRTELTGYLLYSVGPNGTDDGGRDADSDPQGDDIAVRVPLKVK